MSKPFLFICGCPRSGTTALWRLLVGDTRLCLGVERYGNRFYTRDFLTPDLFEKQRFLSFEKGDTFYSDLAGFNPYYSKVVDIYDNAVYVGDKIPRLYAFFDKLCVNFPKCKTIVIIRNIFDVAASYKARFLDVADNWNKDVFAAVSDWNSSNEAINSYHGDLKIVDYEKLFIEKEGLEDIYAFLDLDITDQVLASFKNIISRSSALESHRPRSLNALEVKKICETADFDSYRRIINKIK